MAQIKKFQQGGYGTQPTSVTPSPKKKTYYDDLKLLGTSTQYISGLGQKETDAVFQDGPGYYQAHTTTYEDGSRKVWETGDRNDVSVYILNGYDPYGNVVLSDTTYNNLQRGEVGYEHLQRQFVGQPYYTVGEDEPLYPGTPDAEINQRTSPTRQEPPKAIRRHVNTSIKKQGGYLRLQKQGGKLTEVWTPFN